LDSANAILVYQLSEETVLKWREEKIRVYDLALSADNQRLAVVANDQHSIIVYDFPNRQKLMHLSYEDVNLTSIRISTDGLSILASMNPDLIKEISMETGEVSAVSTSHTQKKFMIRSSFGGATESFVVSGSEDSKIYIWRRNEDTAEMIQVLTGHHKGCVNAISWNFSETGMFASAGDDSTVRM
jgi:WD40 repeat protein